MYATLNCTSNVARRKFNLHYVGQVSYDTVNINISYTSQYPPIR